MFVLNFEIIFKRIEVSKTIALKRSTVVRVFVFSEVKDRPFAVLAIDGKDHFESLDISTCKANIFVTYNDLIRFGCKTRKSSMSTKSRNCYRE